MRYIELASYLFSIKDQKHAEFSGNLSNSSYITIGVKNPILRSIIKEHYKDTDLCLEDFECSKYLEIDFLYFGIGLKRCKTIEEQLVFLDKNIKYAQSWAVTDTINHSLKKCSFDLFWEFFLSHYQNEHIYTRRFSYIFGLMAEAWLLSTIAIEYPQQVFELLKKMGDQKLKLKTISKICDSLRFSDAQKEHFKSLRLN